MQAKAKKLPISVMVLTKNEEKNIATCIRSLGWAAQVLVVDCQSTDRTVAIARRLGADVVVHPWQGYTAQRNFALLRCTQPWVMTVDADEWVAPDLERALAGLMAMDPAATKQGYAVWKVNNYFGRWLRFGGIYPGANVCVFKRSGARFESGRADVHEGVQIPDSGLLKGHKVHQAYPGMELALEKVNRYTDLEAYGRAKRGDQAGYYAVLWRPLERFFKNYFIKFGFLDGVQGLLYCFLTGYYTFIFNLKIWEQSRGKNG